MTGAMSTAPVSVSAPPLTLVSSLPMPSSGVSPVVSLTAPATRVLPDTTPSAASPTRTSPLPRPVNGTRPTSRCFSRTLSPHSKKLAKKILWHMRRTWGFSWRNSKRGSRLCLGLVTRARCKLRKKLAVRTADAPFFVPLY